MNKKHFDTFPFSIFLNHKPVINNSKTVYFLLYVKSLAISFY